MDVVLVLSQKQIDKEKPSSFTKISKQALKRTRTTSKGD